MRMEMGRAGEQLSFPFMQESPGIGRPPKEVNPEEALTKREYFAAMALQGLLSAIYANKDMLTEFTKKEFGSYRSGSEAISENAVTYADALIKELNKTQV